MQKHRHAYKTHVKFVHHRKVLIHSIYSYFSTVLVLNLCCTHLIYWYGTSKWHFLCFHRRIHFVSKADRNIPMSSFLYVEQRHQTKTIFYIQLFVLPTSIILHSFPWRAFTESISSGIPHVFLVIFYSFLCHMFYKNIAVTVSSVFSDMHQSPSMYDCLVD